MRNHLLHMNGKGRIVPIEANTPSEEYGRLQLQFEVDAGGRKEKWDFADFITLYDHCKVGDIYYDEELAGPNGMRFRLWPFPGTTKAAIDRAKQQLRRDRDVVSLQVLRIEQMI